MISSDGDRIGGPPPARSDGSVRLPRAWFPVATGIACVVIGIAGMVGVITRTPVLVRVVESTTPIRFNTSLCLAVAGAGLVAAARGRRVWVWATAAVVAIVAGLTAIEYVLDVDLGIDELVRDNPLAPGQLPRMAPNTAAALVVAALALALVAFDGRRRWMPAATGIAGAFVGSVGVVALLGYAIGVSTAYRWGDAVGISVTGSIGTLLLAAGLVERAWHGSARFREGIPGWVPLAIGTVVVVANVALVESISDVEMRAGESIHDVEGASEMLVVAAASLAGLLVLTTHFALAARRQASRVRVEHERFQRIVDANIVGITIGAPSGRVLGANDYYLDVIGYTREELEADRIDWRAVTPAEWLAVDERAIAELRERGSCPAYEKEFVRRDGTRVPVLIALAQLPGPGGLIAAFVLDHTEQRRSRELLRESQLRLVGAQEEERRRIAADIHDDPVQKMTAVGIQLDVVRRSIADPGAQRSLDALGELVSLAIGRLRELLFELRPPALERGGLADSVMRFGEEMTDAGVDLTVEDRLVSEPPPETGVVAYRIIQEALSNIRKHSRATRATVTLETTPDGIAVRVEDDGDGIPAERLVDPVLGHIGVEAMRERAALAGGWCRIDGTAGTTVECFLPVVPPAPVPEPP
jgi:PAS domain S-box-containing protein